MLMLDLFAGKGGASQAMQDHGWEVITVDINPDFNPTIIADITEFQYKGPKPDLIWASPPCTEFSKSSMPLSWACNKKKPPNPDVSLMLAAKRLIEEIEPEWWIIENVRGSIKYFEPYLGCYQKKSGSRYLWGRFPIFDCDPCYGKWKLPPSADRAAIRSLIPYHMSLAICLAVEKWK